MLWIRFLQWEQFCAVEITPGQVVAKDYYDYETNRVRRKKNHFSSKLFPRQI